MMLKITLFLETFKNYVKDVVKIAANRSWNKYSANRIPVFDEVKF